MVSHLFFYQLTLIALVWLCVMLHWVWPSNSAAACPPPLEPPPPRPKRHREATPFAGLTTKPHCDACASSSAPHPQTPSVPPPRIVPTRGRRREVDTSRHFCPNPDCAYRGWVGWGNLRANGHPGGGRWRQLLCIVCRGYFLETLGTIFHGKRSSPDLIVRVIACLAEGLGIRGTARVFEVDPNTVLQWLVEAADQLQAFSHYLAVYLSDAANCDGPLPSRLHVVNQPVIRSSLEVSRPRAARLASSRAHLPPGISRSSSSTPAYSAWGCGHGGTRNMSTSRRLHTRSVNPAAIAGVHDRHCLAEPPPLVGSGCGSG
jgi:hypothetical protein